MVNYVVKVGEYYVRKAELIEEIESFERTNYYIGEILLSREMSRGMSKRQANAIAKEINGEVVEIKEEVSCE